MNFKIKPLLRETVEINKRFYRGVLKKIPTFIWGGFAVVGILVGGFLLGYVLAYMPLEESELDHLSTENAALYEVVTAYEEMTDLYREERSTSMNLLDTELMKDEDVYNQTYEDLDIYRDLMMIQHGRLLELRKKAGLPETPFDEEEELQSDASFL